MGRLGADGGSHLKKFFPTIAFVAVALASLFMAGFAYFATQEAARIKFAATADDAVSRIESRIDLHLSLLRSTQALFDARGGIISSNEFKSFFDALDVDGNFAGLRGIGFPRMIKPGDEAVAERAISRDQGFDRTIYPASSSGPWRAPVVLFEPLDEAGRRAIGYDMMSDPTRRVALERALADDEQHASGLTMLGGQTGADQKFPGFVVFVRLNVRTAPDGTETAGRRTTGFLFASFRAQQLFQAALRHAEATGEGQHVDMALFDSQISVLANQNLNYLVSGTAPVQMGNAHPNIAPYEVLPVSDGHFILAVGNDGQFAKFCAVVGLGALAADPAFATNAARVANRVALREHVVGALSAFDRDTLLAALEKAGVPASPINTIGQMFADPQTVARGMRLDLDDGRGNALPSVRAPMVMSETPLAYGRPSPRLGEHTAEILAELGLTASEDAAAH